MRRFTPGRSQAVGLERAGAFAVAAALPIALALFGGGYDLVVRQATALAVWILIAGGLALGVLPRATPARVAWVPLAALAALAGLTAMGLIGTPSDERTLAELARVLGYAGLVVLAWLGLGPRTWSAACAGLLAAASAITALALASRLAPAAFPVGPLEDLLGSDRLFYPLGYWNAVAAWAAMTAVALVAWSLQGRVTWHARLALASVPGCVLALYFTFSRGGFLALVAGLLAVVLLSRNRLRAIAHVAAAAAAAAALVLVARAYPQIVGGTGGRGGTVVLLAVVAAGALCAAVPRWSRAIRPAEPSRRFPVAVGLLGAAATAVIAIGALTGIAYRAWDEFSAGEPVAAAALGDDPSERLTSAAGDRYAYWSEALTAFGSDPLGGIGPGTFDLWWSAEADRQERVRDAHSVFLEQLAELGVGGALAICALFAGSLWAAIAAHRGSRRPAAAIAMTGSFCAYVAIAAIDWTWEFAALGALALCGVAAAAAAGSRPLSRDRGRRRAAFPPWARAAAAALAVLAAAVQVPGLVSTQLVRGSAASLAAGDLDQALARADDAVDAAPWAASAYAQRARVRIGLEQPEAALADALEAGRLEPLDRRWQALEQGIRNRLAARFAVPN